MYCHLIQQAGLMPIHFGDTCNKTCYKGKLLWYWWYRKIWLFTESIQIKQSIRYMPNLSELKTFIGHFLNDNRAKHWNIVMQNLHPQ